MSSKDNCYDNSVVECFFHFLKVELVNDENFITRQQAKSEIFHYIEGFYNKRRVHSTLGYCSPDEFEQQCFLAEVAYLTLQKIGSSSGKHISDDVIYNLAYTVGLTK